MQVDAMIIDDSADIQPIMGSAENGQHTTKTSTADFGLYPRQITVMLDQSHTRVR